MEILLPISNGMVPGVLRTNFLIRVIGANILSSILAQFCEVYLLTLVFEVVKLFIYLFIHIFFEIHLFIH
jgi:hypothetical protein